MRSAISFCFAVSSAGSAANHPARFTLDLGDLADVRPSILTASASGFSR